MFTYAGSKQCDLGPIYTTTNTHAQHIRIYPGKLTSILVKVSPDQDVNMPKKTKLYSHFFLLRTYISGLSFSHECKYGVYSDLSSYAVNLPG